MDLSGPENVGGAAPKPVLVVGGLGRCGTSLLMQMLQAGGVPCAGDWPAFEPAEAGATPIDPTWFAGLAGRAVKILDPHLARPPVGRVPSVGIWMVRGFRQQARSQAKFAHAMSGGLLRNDRNAVRRIEASLFRDSRLGRAAMPHPDLAQVSFEELLERPAAVAVRLAAWLAPWWPGLDHAAMARCVRPRGPECLPGLLELALVAEAEAGVAGQGGMG